MVHNGLGVVDMKKTVAQGGSDVQMDGAEYRPGARCVHPASPPLQQLISRQLFSRDDPGQSLGPKSSGTMIGKKNRKSKKENCHLDRVDGEGKEWKGTKDQEENSLCQF